MDMGRNVQAAADGAAENPELSRRGAFAAGGVALAALVAGGCGWLAMNARENSGGDKPMLTAAVVDEEPRSTFKGFSATVDEQQALFEQGIPSNHARFVLEDTPRTVPEIENPRTAYVEFSYKALEVGRPYMFVSDVYLQKWTHSEDADGQGPVEYCPDGKPGFVSSNTYVARTGKVVVPDSSSGKVSVEVTVPAELGENESYRALTGWNLLDIH